MTTNFQSRTSFMARYYQKDVPLDAISVLAYRNNLEIALPIIKDLDLNSIEDIIELVSVLKVYGIYRFEDSNSFYCDFDEEHRNYVGAFPIGSGFMNLFKAKNLLITLDSKDVSRETFIDLLKFFRYISDGVNNVTDQMIEDIINQKNYYTNLSAVETEETFYAYRNLKMKEFTLKQKSYAQLFKELISKESGINIEYGRKFTNRYGNILQSVRIILKGQRGDADLIVYIPTMIDGVYSLGSNKFVLNKTYEDYLKDSAVNPLKIMIRTLIEGTLSFSKAYKLSQDNKQILRGALQTALNGLLFSKRIIQPNSETIRLEADKNIMTYQEAKELLKCDHYYHAPFTVIGNSYSCLTPFEVIVEHHKLYFREYIEASKSTGSLILKNLGKFGYEQYRNFPLSNRFLNLFDPGYMNNKADFVVAYLTEKSLIDMNPFSMYNDQSFRNAAASFIIGHAFELEVPKQKPLTLSNVMMKYIPSYNMLFAMMDFVDSKGNTTFEGNRIINKHYADTLGLWHCAKIAFNGFDKGVSYITGDDIYVIHNGVKHPVNVTSMVNMASRKNFGVLYEGLYNSKKYFEGNLEQEVRDFYKKPLNKEELMPLMEVFVNGESFGKHPVGLMQSFFIKEMDSSYKDVEVSDSDDEQEINETSDIIPSFKSYKLGLEWFSRARLMGAHSLNTYLLGDDSKIMDDIYRLIDDPEAKLYGKNGKVTNRFQREVVGFNATATPNAYLRPDQTIVYATEMEFGMIMINLRRIDKTIDPFKLKSDFDNGIEIQLPPGLNLRNPSIDDANTIFADVKLLKADKYTLHGFIQVNPLTWLRMGGDFDGDTATILFFPKELRGELKKYFSYSLRNIKELGFEYSAREILLGKSVDIFDASSLHTLPKKYPYNNVEEFINWVSYVKKFKHGKEESAKAYANEMVTLSNTAQAREDVLVKASSNLMTTRISKQLIGVSKTITMKATFMIEDYFYSHNIESQELKDLLREMADEMNYTLVQPTIDIQKWSDNLQEVIKTVLLVYRMSEAVAMFVENEFYPTFRTFAILRELGIKSRIIERKFKVYDGEVKTFYNFKNGVDIKSVLSTDSLEYGYQKYLYTNQTLENYAVGKETYNGVIFSLRWNCEEQQWKPTTDPVARVKELIDVINPKGTVYNNILKLTEEDMKDFDATKAFYTFNKEALK